MPVSFSLMLRSASGRKFQIVEAAKEKERRPLADRISGTVSRCLSRDLKFRVGDVGNDEISQVRRLSILKRFECNCCNFERNSLTDRKPMYVFESRSDMMVTPNRRDDDTTVF